MLRTSVGSHTLVSSDVEVVFIVEVGRLSRCFRREVGTVLVQKAALVRKNHLEAAYVTAQAAHNAKAAATLLGSGQKDNFTWKDEYYKGCICFFLGKHSSAQTHAQKAFFSAPWQTCGM